MAQHLAFIDIGPSGQRAEFTLLHGFSQNSRCWTPFDELLSTEAHVRLFDLPGHGGSSDVFVDLQTSAQMVAAQMNESIVCGYSMGGRVALHLALLAPAKVQGLVAIGATAGLRSENERSERRQRDEQLAVQIRQQGVSAFLDDWLAQPLFAHLKNTHRDQRQTNTSEGLARSLELCGTGTQHPLWDQLPQLSMPVLLLSGAEDEKFTQLAFEMAETIGDNASVAVIAGAGHSVQLEQPKKTAIAITDWQTRCGL